MKVEKSSTVSSCTTANKTLPSPWDSDYSNQKTNKLCSCTVFRVIDRELK